MKKLTPCILALISLFFIPTLCEGQICYVDPSVHSSVVQTYLPTNLIAGKTTLGSLYPINITPDGSAFYHNNQAGIDACIARAKAIWGTILSSPDITNNLSININLSFEDDGYSPSGFVEGHTFVVVHENFGHAPYSHVLYPQSLANFIVDNSTGASGNTWGGHDMTVHINSNASLPWNFNFSSCPSGQVDFLTVLTHEIAHGLGFITSTNIVSPSTQIQLRYETDLSGTYDGDPTAYDIVIDDQGGGLPPSAGSCLTTLTYIYHADPTGGFQTYCTGQGNYTGVCGLISGSNSLYSDCGYFSGILPVPQVFLPNPFAAGSSICHLNETFPPTSTSNNELMQPSTVPGSQLVPSPNDLAILSAIGWNVQSPVGVGDYVSINASNCSSDPSQVIDPGTTNHYCEGGTAAVDPTIAHWTLSLLASDGPHIVATQTGYSVWNLNLPLSSIPSGHIWTRDLNGRIAGILSYTGSDGGIPAHNYSTSIGVGVNYEPQKIEVSLKNSSEFWCECNKAILSFFAPGATSYRISYREQSAFGLTYWSSWSTPVTVPSGIVSYDFNSLNETSNYQFQVEAINSAGTIASDIIERTHCKNIIHVSPNPILAHAHHLINVQVNPGDDGGHDGYGHGIDNNIGVNGAVAHIIKLPTPGVDPCGPITKTIKNVTFIQASNPTIRYEFHFSGLSNSVNIDASMLPGIYTMTVSSIAGVIASQTYEVD